eukprot:7142624-Lingulodinium_polyedra.AAC.1
MGCANCEVRHISKQLSHESHYRDAFHCCGAARCTTHALHASTATWWSTHAVRESRDVRRHSNGMRFSA